MQSRDPALKNKRIKNILAEENKITRNLFDNTNEHKDVLFKNAVDTNKISYIKEQLMAGYNPFSNRYLTRTNNKQLVSNIKDKYASVLPFLYNLKQKKSRKDKTDKTDKTERTRLPYDLTRKLSDFLFSKKNKRVLKSTQKQKKIRKSKKSKKHMKK